MLRRGRGSDLKCWSPATDDLQISSHDAVQVPGVTLSNTGIVIIDLKMTIYGYILLQGMDYT